jgi:hypothetical protein
MWIEVEYGKINMTKRIAKRPVGKRIPFCTETQTLWDVVDHYN